MSWQARSDRELRGRVARAAALGLCAMILTSSIAVSAEAPTAAGETDVIDPPPQRISAQIAQDLGNDPEAIFRFVADEVRYEPYSGALRGASGTYYSRAGNSVDQALLLARLLDAANVRTRFARCTPGIGHR